LRHGGIIVVRGVVKLPVAPFPAVVRGLPKNSMPSTR